VEATAAVPLLGSAYAKWGQVGAGGKGFPDNSGDA
jgi:hypothetical protein